MSQFPNQAYKYSNMDPSRSVVLDLLKGLDTMAHRSGNYMGVNILYGDGSVIFQRDTDNVIKEGGDLIDTQDGVAWRTALRALE